MDFGQQPQKKRTESIYNFGFLTTAVQDYKHLAKRIIARRLEEKLINDYAELQTTLRKVVNSLAYLSLTWSTVVLLGGFVSVLKLIDFWFLTAISTSFALNLADLYECKIAFSYAALNMYIGVRYALVNQFPSFSRVGRGGHARILATFMWIAEAWLGVLIVAAYVVLQILMISPLLAIILSLVRLAVHRYGDAGGDAANAAKLRASLQIFYSLALAQNALFCLWLMFKLYEPTRAGIVRRRCGFGSWSADLVQRYARETREMCATQGQVPQGRNLVTFAVGLLGSESMDERRDAVRLLDKLLVVKAAGAAGRKKKKTTTQQQEEEEEEAEKEKEEEEEEEELGLGLGPKLLPCKVPLENLLEALEVGDVQSRERAARVVVALAGDLRHNDWCFPTALNHIASLLQVSVVSSAEHNKAMRRRRDQQQAYYYHDDGDDDDDDDDDHHQLLQLQLQHTIESMIKRSNIEHRMIERLSEGPIYWSILYFLRFNSLSRKRRKQEEDEEEKKQKQDDDISVSAQQKRLISQGLLIVERLTLHQANRVHICNNHALLSGLTAPLYSHALLDAEYDGEWMDMLGRSLRIVGRLIKAPGGTAEASRGLRGKIASNKQAVLNLTRILEDSNKFCTPLKTAAIEILAELAPPGKADESVANLGKDDIKKFISQLWGIFFAQVDVDDGSSSSSNAIEEEEQREKQATARLRQIAGEALALMLSAWDPSRSSDILEMFIQTTTATGSEQGRPAPEQVGHVVGKLTDLVNSKHESSPTRAAQILACLCSHLTMNTELASQYVIKMLKKVFQLILIIPCESKTTNKMEMDFQVVIGTGLGPTNKGNKSSRKTDEGQQEEKGFLVALLSLAVVICDRMVDAQSFACAAPEDMASLVKKLKDIIQMNNTVTVECLQTVKLSCQLVVSMMQLKPICIKDFIEDNFMDVLSESSKMLSDLDNCLMLFDVNYLQVTKTDKPRVSLVKKAQKLLPKHKKPGDVWNLVSVLKKTGEDLHSQSG